MDLGFLHRLRDDDLLFLFNAWLFQLGHVLHAAVVCVYGRIVRPELVFREWTDLSEVLSLTLVRRRHIDKTHDLLVALCLDLLDLSLKGFFIGTLEV